MSKPTLPKGTRDFGPAQMAKRDFIFRNIRQVFQKFGFQPLETPAMENLSTLTGKYGEEGDQLLFRVLNSGDFIKEVPTELLKEPTARNLGPHIADKGLRYDLTVPFARYVVMNRHEITFPFKRYQMQPVWRADRPQKGRYREFYQCDADVVGTDSLWCEAEIILMIHEVFESLHIKNFTIKMNHRGILSAMARMAGAADREMSLFVAIDKLDKIGADKVREELMDRGFAATHIDALFSIISFQGTNEEKLRFLNETFAKDDAGMRSVKDVAEVFTLLENYGMKSAPIEFDIALARGLSYYTGCIFEVKIADVPIGSVSGGGRYDNLTSVFDSKERSSGVGISFGVDRMYDAMEALHLFPAEARIVSKVLVCPLGEECFSPALRVLHLLHQAGIAAEIFPDHVKAGKQLDYANKKSIPYALIIGSDELKSGVYTLKQLATGEQVKLHADQLVDTLTKKA